MRRYLQWAHDSRQPTEEILRLLIDDLVALADEDMHAALRCLDYAGYTVPPTVVTRRRRRKALCARV